jgi:leader peptidase (prepilin peptidase)/N-methyltransferase
VSDQLAVAIFPALALLAGLLLGSFLNVCIYRWPRDLSVASPSRSFCPSCEKQIAWYDNIPVLSYLVLKGRCRACAAPIPWRYPVVELLTAISFTLLVVAHGPTLEALRGCVFAALLIGCIFSDLETLLLPDEFTLGGIVLGLGFSLLVPVRDATFELFASIFDLHLPDRLLSLAESALGAALPAFLMWLMGVIFEKVRNKEGLGFGDVKMIAMIGAFLGLTGTLQTVIIASVAGSIIGLIWLRLSKQDNDTYQPFGTFLGIAALATAIAGQNWFWRVLGN